MGAGTIFSSDVADLLIETIDSIIDDPDSYKAKDYKLWMDVRTMSKPVIDDQEWGGLGLAYEVGEGENIPSGDIRKGFTTRYLARRFGIKMAITEEAMEDCRYDQVIQAAGRLNRALQKTLEIDCHNLLNRGFSTSYVFGDGQPVWSASHTLPGGVGTWSNKASVSMSPSRIALTQAATAVARFPGHDGLTEGYKLDKLLCPIDQRFAWSGILRSDKVPESGNNEVNVVRELGLTLVPLTYWDSTTTSWALTTDAPDGGFRFYWRRKPRSRSWPDNNPEIMNHQQSARWCWGMSDFRGTYGVE